MFTKLDIVNGGWIGFSKLLVWALVVVLMVGNILNCGKKGNQPDLT